jgi:hypothetical protein
MVTNYKDYNSSRIYENFKIAKEYLLKKELIREIEKYKKEKEAELLAKKEEEGEDPAEESEPIEIKVPEAFKKKTLVNAEKKLDSDEKFSTLRGLLDKNPNYALPFTKFIYDQGGSINDIEATFNQIMDNKHLLSKLPKTIDEYSKILPKKEKSEDGTEKVIQKPGYEILIDDLLSAKESGKIDKFYKSLEKTAKAAQKLYQEGAAFSKPVNPNWISDIKKVSPELRQKLDYAVSTMVDKKGDKGLHQLSQAAMTYMTGKYGKSIEDYINYAAEIAEAQGSDIYDVAEVVDSAGSIAARILYMGDNWLIVAIRSPEAQKLICARASTFCINNGSFWTYAKGRIQYGIFNFNRKESDPLSFIGATVDYNGTVTDFQNQLNHSVKRGNTFKENLESIGVPPEGIKETLDSIPSESNIRKLTDEIFQNNEKVIREKGWKGFLNKVNTESNRSIAGTSSLTSKDYNLLFQVCVDILKGQFTKEKTPKDPLTPEEIIRFYKRNGIYSEFGLEAFNMLSEGKATPQDKEVIKKSTKEFLYEEGPSLLKDVEKRLEANPKLAENSIIKTAKYVVDNKEEIEKIIEQI